MKSSIRLLTLLLILLLAACGGNETNNNTANDEAANNDADNSVAEVEPTEAPAEPTEAPAEPTEAPAEPTEVPPTAEPEPEPVAAPSVNITDGCVTDYAEGVDYFPEKATVSYTEGFTIEYFDNYKVVTVPAPFPGAEMAETYVLVQCGTPAPEGFDDALVVETPVERLVSMSTTYLPHLVQFGLLDRLVGVDASFFITSPDVRALVDAGALTEIGSGADINVEAALDLEPELVMTFASGSADFDSGPRLAELGIPVATNADYLDTNPLGRAEWGKFIATFFNVEGEAEAWFEEVAVEYEALAELAASAESSPTVFSQTPFEGTWFMPGGNSFTAALLADANAAYLWADDESTGSLFLDFESVLDVAAEADFWLDIGFYATLDDLLAADERFAAFAPYGNGTIWNNDLKLSDLGGNDFFESGAANPHLVLGDLIAIFHPELLPDHVFTYYRPVTN